MQYAPRPDSWLARQEGECPVFPGEEMCIRDSFIYSGFQYLSEISLQVSESRRKDVYKRQGKRFPGYIFGKYSYKTDDFPKNKWYNKLIIRRWKRKWKSEEKNGNRN